jgi:hypothetical protein
MKLSWWLNVIGLVVGVAAAPLMYYFPPNVQIYTDKGEPLGSWIGAPTQEGKLRVKWQKRAVKAAPLGLGLSFVLQLAAALFLRLQVQYLLPSSFVYLGFFGSCRESTAS